MNHAEDYNDWFFWHSTQQNAIAADCRKPGGAQPSSAPPGTPRKNAHTTLTPAERAELAALRNQADRSMVRKAYAWALLRWRGYPLPNLDEIPLN
jgi:hypothetical protein